MEAKVIEKLVSEGVSLTYKGNLLTICDLNDHNVKRDNRKYQVHCDDRKYAMSELYDSIEIAVDKFLLLKGLLT